MIILPEAPVIRPLNGGLFRSIGHGMHPERVIDSWELIVVQRGHLAMHEAQQPFRLAAGETLLLQPGRVHGGLEPYSIDLAFYWIHFQVADAEHVAASDATMSVPQTAALRQPLKLIELCRRFLDDQERDPSLFAATGGLLIRLMLLEVIHDRRHADVPPGARGSHLAERALPLIAEYAARGVSTADLARLLQCNPDYLGRVVRAHTGRSVTDLLQQARVRLAKADLLDPRLAIGDVAGRCGFADGAHFRRVFKHHTGLGPAAWRSLYARVHVNTR